MFIAFVPYLRFTRDNALPTLHALKFVSTKVGATVRASSTIAAAMWGGTLRVKSCKVSSLDPQTFPTEARPRNSIPLRLKFQLRAFAPFSLREPCPTSPMTRLACLCPFRLCEQCPTTPMTRRRHLHMSPTCPMSRHRHLHMEFFFTRSLTHSLGGNKASRTKAFG